MLERLGFELAVPTPLRFLHHYLQLTPLPASPLSVAPSVRRLSEALLELMLYDSSYLRALPSVQVSA